MLQMVQSQGNLAKARQLINSIKAMRNPQSVVMNAINQNPEIKSFVESAGGDYKKAFYAMAQQKGVNPDDILNMMK